MSLPSSIWICTPLKHTTSPLWPYPHICQTLGWPKSPLSTRITRSVSSATIASAAIATDANNPPLVTDLSHGVRPVADPLPLHHDAAPLTNININNHVMESSHTTPRHQR